MNAILDFAAAHPVFAGLIGATMFASLILAAVAILFQAQEPDDDGHDWSYWD